MNGCHPDKIQDEKCICEFYSMQQTCLSKEDTVSRINGQPICPYKFDAVSRKEWIRLHGEE